MCRSKFVEPTERGVNRHRITNRRVSQNIAHPNATLFEFANRAR
jgi:hypothetical protein